MSNDGLVLHFKTFDCRRPVMTDLARSVRSTLLALSMVGALFDLSGGLVTARAGSVLSTLSLPFEGTFPGEQVGAAIQIGSIPILLQSVVYQESFSNGPTLGETFAVFSRNPVDGTVGSLQFNAFTLSFDGGTFLTTATATAPFVLEANTSYWLVMVETPGTFGDWDNSLPFDDPSKVTYSSAFGVTIPLTSASFSFFDGSYTYLDAVEGLQLFELIGVPVPEPPGLVQALCGGAVVAGGLWLRRRRLKR
jgi:hypothetical protein